MTVYLVKRQMAHNGEWVHDELIDVCSTIQKALEYVDMPNYDIIITSYEVDGGPDSERLVENLSSYR